MARFFAFTLLIITAFALRVFCAEGPAYARLRVDSDPPGADVVIVAELGKTPLVNEFIVPGMYKIELRHVGGYLPAAEELTLRADQQALVSRRLKKPQLFTKHRLTQLALGAGAAAGFGYAVQTQGERSALRQKHYSAQSASREEGDWYAQKSAEYLSLSKDAELKRTLALIGAGILTVALQVTIFIW
jgi:hypothetical protein